MALFLDSTDPAEARAAAELGFIAGITTNPVLIAKTGRRPEEVIANLCAVGPGIVFHQLTAEAFGGLMAEAECFLSLVPGRVALKIPCHRDGLQLASRLSARAVCAVTAIYTPAQAYAASEAGALRHSVCEPRWATGTGPPCPRARVARDGFRFRPGRRGARRQRQDA